MAKVPPLTKDQAEELYNAAGLNSSFAGYRKYNNVENNTKKKAIEKIIQEYTNQSKQIPFEELIEQAKHPCSEEALTPRKFPKKYKNYYSIFEFMNNFENEVKQNKSFFSKPKIDKDKQEEYDFLKDYIDRDIEQKSFFVVNGFRKQLNDNLEKNKNGDITGVIEVSRTAFPKCHKNLKRFNLISFGKPCEYSLTREQAEQILDASKFPTSLNKYKDIFIKEAIDLYSQIPLKKRRPFNILLKLAKNPCSIEPLTLSHNKDAILPPFERIEDFGKQIENTSDPEEKKELNNSFLGNIKGVIMTLIYGFDDVSSDHFIFDEDQEVIDTTPTERGRYSTLCIPYLEEQKKKKTAGIRKTYRHKNSERKTLRRRKLRRNMH
jgi:hypothetical protein